MKLVHRSLSVLISEIIVITSCSPGIRTLVVSCSCSGRSGDGLKITLLDRLKRYDVSDCESEIARVGIDSVV
jgi:hypothetical protein